jgi:phosphopantothenoylcysteine decarboxylase/phosphopantothenate--cysteine ligase
MRCLVTIGPTFEPLDQVRRLTNFSTGRLGTELANFLQTHGHEVTALRGSSSTYSAHCHAQTLRHFDTTSDLLARLRESARGSMDAIFHAAAVSDFAFGSVYRRDDNQVLEPIHSGKFSTEDGSILVELVPTPKIIRELRTLFPKATLFGWKYEVEGSPRESVAKGVRQIADNKTDFSVVNGPAYGDGFGIISPAGDVEHCANAPSLFTALLKRVGRDSAII